MNKEVKALWVKALRSGQYRQTSGRLRNATNEFCCLGVLCNIHAQKHPSFALNQTHPRRYDGHEGTTPPIVRHWADLDEGTEEQLINMNDDDQWTFKQIADWIETNL